MYAVRSLLLLLAAARAAGTSAPSPLRGGWQDLDREVQRGTTFETRKVGSSTAARGMRAIFLDIDGVLLPFGEDAAANAEGSFSPEALEALREIIRSSGKVPAHPGGNPGAKRWFLQSTPIQMPPESGGICGRLT